MTQSANATQGGYRAPETRQVEARCYWSAGDESPCCIVVNGVVYSREQDQDQARLRLAVEEVEAELVAEHGAGVRPLLLQYEEALNAVRDCDGNATEQRLLDSLPSHARVIRHAFRPEECRLSAVEALRHQRCTLPPAG